jgi:hypothetical protein
MAIRRAQLEGREHFVIPTVLLTVGVHHGSEGPLFYPLNELAASSRRWNGMPLVIYHPTINGMGISAADPEVFDSQKVGHVFNARMIGMKLVAEAWIDTARLTQIDPVLHERIASGNSTIEISTGLFTENVYAPGRHHGVDYEVEARFMVPDHLAILPDQIGACSVAKGCGLFAGAAA